MFIMLCTKMDVGILSYQGKCIDIEYKKIYGKNIKYFD
jgi:hypothetical protein